MKKLILLLTALTMHGAVTNYRLEGVTAQQAILRFTVPDVTQCTVLVYRDAGRTQLIDDTNTARFSGSTGCNRNGSVVNGVISNGSATGTDVQFIVGTRASTRSLAFLTTYYGTITDTLNSSTTSFQFTTDNVPVGSLFPPIPGFNSNTWDNRDYPVFSLASANRDQLYVDPTTGIPVKRMTMGGDGFYTNQQKYFVGDSSGQAPVFDTVTIVGGTCTTCSNVFTNGVSYATLSAAASIWLPFPQIVPSGGGGWNGYNEGWTLDYMHIYAWGSADSTARGAGNNSDHITICFAQTSAGCYHGSNFNLQLGASNAKNYVPQQNPDPVFDHWGFTMPPVRGDLVPAAISVSVTGSTLTRQSGDFFQTTWPSGVNVQIPGSSSWSTPCANNLCTISSITNATTATIGQACTSGCPSSGSPAAAVVRPMGVLITRQASSGTIQLSLGYEFGGSYPQMVGEDSLGPHCNSNPVNVTTDAHGSALGYTLQGYLCFIGGGGAGTYYLVIPKNVDGSPRGESRPVGTSQSPVAWNSNGASLGSGGNFLFAGWDTTSGTTFYSAVSYNSGATFLLVKGAFDTARYSFCNPAWQYWQDYLVYSTNGQPRDSCFTYTNLTNPSQNRDAVSQIKTAYATANPGFDLSGFVASSAVYDSGFFVVCMASSPSGGTGPGSLQVCGTFNLSGTLIQIFDTFSVAASNNFSLRWGYQHGPTHMLGNWHLHTVDAQAGGAGSTAVSLGGPWMMGISAVNRAGFGATANWDTSTSIAANEAYGCPTGLPSYLVNAGASGSHCIQLRFNTEPCSRTPYSATIYPGGKTEAQQFPCPTNSSWSHIQDLALGDAIYDAGQTNVFGEFLIVVTKNKVSSTQIECWVIRGDGVWPNNVNSPYRTISNTHSAGWNAMMQANYAAIAQTAFMHSTDTSSTWQLGNPTYSLSHGAGILNDPEHNSVFTLNPNTGINFQTFFNQPISSILWYPLVDTGSAMPILNGSTADYRGSFVQFYADASQRVARSGELQWVAYYRHLNPPSGTNTGSDDTFGLGATGYNLSLVSGLSQTYTLTDPYSGGSPNIKLLPFGVWAARFHFQDISGSASLITDANAYSYCYAYANGECRPGSTSGTFYINVPYAQTSAGQCYVDQHTQLAPCRINLGPVQGQIAQAWIGGSDLSAQRQRILGQALTGIGRQHQYAEPKMISDASWLMFSCTWKDGTRSEVCMMALPPFVVDGKVRTGYVNYPDQVSGATGDTVRVSFGYAENASYGCVSRGERCWTSSNATQTSPFVFASETQNRTTCASGCTVPVPLIPGRVAYLQVERTSAGGAASLSGVQVVAAQ